IRATTLTYRSGPYAGNSHGREEIGFVPWQFNLPDPGYEAAWRFVMDTAYFFSAHGPTTVERHDPQFQISPHCCVWSGNEWPYATTQTLVAMGNLLNNYRQSVVTAADYARLFKVYTLDQWMNGQPYIAEAANPDNDSWDGHNTPYHSEHYFHSGYVDLVITGIAGLRPRADDSLEVNPLAPAEWNYFALDDVRYHGHQVSIVWDRDGSRYHVGAGLTLISDGKTIAHANRIERVAGYVGAAPAEVKRRNWGPDMRMAGASGWDTTTVPDDSVVNLAVNNGHDEFPRITTSYSAPGTSPHYLNDGNLWYMKAPPNRWTKTGSPNRSDWITLDLRWTQNVRNVTLYFLDDSIGVRPPGSYNVEMWRDNRWVTIPNQRRVPAIPTGHAPNSITFPAVHTDRVRITLNSQNGFGTGLTELESWAPRPHFWDMFDTGDTRPKNVAWGAKASASFMSRYDSVSEINDGIVAFSRYSRNRWTAYGSPNATDWIQLDF